jgi:hypothetical protein
LREAGISGTLKVSIGRAAEKDDAAGSKGLRCFEGTFVVCSDCSSGRFLPLPAALGASCAATVKEDCSRVTDSDSTGLGATGVVGKDDGGGSKGLRCFEGTFVVCSDCSSGRFLPLALGASWAAAAEDCSLVWVTDSPEVATRGYAFGSILLA